MNYVISGEEKFLAKRKINDIIKDALKDEANEMNVVNYDYDKTTIEEVIADCNTVPFFSDNKVIILENCTFLTAGGSIDEKDSDLLLKYLNHPNLSSILILSASGLNLDKRKKLVKALNKLCKFFKYDLVEDFDRSQYINGKLKENHVSLDKTAYKVFLERSSNDMEKINNDIIKLSLYSDVIKAEDVNALVCKPLYDDDKYRFTFIQALYDKNASLLFNIYRDFKALNMEVLSLIGLIESQFRFLLQVKTYSDLGYSENKIASELSANPYRVKKTLENCNNFSSKKISIILNELAELDQKFKKGLIDINTGFELFLIKECQ